MIITGKNDMFYALWDINKQRYTIYKDGKFIINCYRFSEVKNYIN